MRFVLHSVTPSCNFYYQQLHSAEMVFTKRKLEFKKPPDKTIDSLTATDIFKNLISALESPEGIKSHLLKSSYLLLIQLSSKQQLCMSKGADLNELFMKTNEGEIRLSLRDVHTLSCIFFKNLQKRLKQLHISNHDVSFSRSLELEELKLLIRCCMVSLTFDVPQEHLLESGKVLLLMFKKLSLLEVAEVCHGNADLKKSNSCQCMYSGENSFGSFAKVASLSSLELFNPCISSITVILEVIIDELLMHNRVRKYLQTIDFLSPTNERLFKHDTNSGDFGLTIDMTCSHFSLSFSDERALQEFINRITGVHSNNFKSLELNIIAARTLLQNPVVLSSPKLFQAYIVSLVSDVISVGIKKSESLTPHPGLIDCYLSVFESSVILYTQHMSILKTENHSAGARGTLVNLHNKSSQSCFESCIDLVKMQKLDQTITWLNDSWNSNLRTEFFKSKSDLIDSSIEYIHQRVCILDETCRDEILSFLNCMLKTAANDVNDIELPLNGDASLHDICLLASLLMLMSNSLIQAVWCLRSRYSKSSKDLLVCKEYDFIVGVISCFKEFGIRLPIQKFTYNMMETHSTSQKELRLMLLHFLGLLSLSFDSRLDFLVKSCVSVIMALTNLFVLEEGNIKALRSLVDPISLSSERSLTIYKETTVYHYSTIGIAAKFPKRRTLCGSNASVANDSTLSEDVRMESVSNTLDPFSKEHGALTYEACNGEMYLNIRLKGSGKVTDFDDLANFVECKKDKDYAAWLKNRDMFRERKLEKRAKLTWEKRKKAWRSR